MMFSNRSLWTARLVKMINVQDIKSWASGSSWPRTLSAVLLLSGAASLAVERAEAFELFGFKLFENDTTEAVEVVDPLSYSVTLEVAGNDIDGDLRSELEAASQLVQGADRPVSGSIGLIQRSNGDFEQLIAALYENARYAGEVRILLDGRRLADLPPDAKLGGSGPVPVRILVDPGKQFRFGDVSVRITPGVCSTYRSNSTRVRLLRSGRPRWMGLRASIPSSSPAWQASARASSMTPRNWLPPRNGCGRSRCSRVSTCAAVKAFRATVLCPSR
jgi:hypothetical protein